MKATIVSAHFNPGHLSHLAALYSLFDELEYDTCLFLNSSYSEFFSDTKMNVIYYQGKRNIPSSDIIIIYAMSKLDLMLIREFRKKEDCKILVVNHEPWRGLKFNMEYLKKQHAGIKYFIGLLAVHEMSKLIMRASDAVLLPSSIAMDFYSSYDKKINHTYFEFPLVYIDETKNMKDYSREYFSYISNATPAKGFPNFIQFLRKYLDIDKDMKAQIVTKADISAYIDDELQKYVYEDRLIIQQGKPLSNEEINKAFLKSCCTWLVYNRSTQSGVLVRAFMCGSPVIASDVGVFPQLVNGKNGLICKDRSPEMIYTMYKEILQNVDCMSKEARKSFEPFLFTKQKENMRNIINKLK